MLMAFLFGLHMTYNLSNTEYMQHVIIESLNTACVANPWLSDIISASVMIGAYIVMQAVSAQQLPCKDQQ